MNHRKRQIKRDIKVRRVGRTRSALWKAQKRKEAVREKVAAVRGKDD